MGIPAAPAAVKLIAGVLAASDPLLDAAQAALAAEIGVIDSISERSDWTQSTYYAAEMGPAIRRQFVSFAVLRAPEELAALKVRANAIEDRWRTARGRQVNIDPGYVGTGQLVLASTKEAAHRLYLRDGIYAEVTLWFRNGSFEPLPYTYRDYAADGVRQYFNGVRATYLHQRRHG